MLQDSIADASQYASEYHKAHGAGFYEQLQVEGMPLKLRSSNVVVDRRAATTTVTQSGEVEKASGNRSHWLIRPVVFWLRVVSDDATLL